MSKNVTLLATISGTFNRMATWSQPEKKREYAILGGDEQIYFMDVTQPTSVTCVDSVPCLYFSGSQKLIVHGQFLYFNDEFMDYTYIIDLSTLPDSVTFLAAISIDNLNLVPGVCFEDQIIYQNTYNDIYAYDNSNPANPVLTDSMSTDLPHLKNFRMVSASNNTIFALHSTAMYLLSFKNHKFSLIDSISLPYTNSTPATTFCQSADNHKLIISYSPYAVKSCVYLLNDSSEYKLQSRYYFSHLSSINETVTTSSFFGNNWLGAATPDQGVRIFNVSDLSDINETGFFSSRQMGQNSTGISTFSFFDSGKILALDINQKTAFILDPSAAMTVPEAAAPQPVLNYALSCFPNPCQDKFSVQLKRDLPCTLELVSLMGITVLSRQYDSSINDCISTDGLTEGSYILKISGNEGQLTKKLLIMH